MRQELKNLVKLQTFNISKTN